ncbi:Uu.00g053640.m01.CDS01 [Anthostomella pinea]|uniref:Uu.00g053640.m01.CDS01 n=1 Tax=Anthostomella pinea TaxID=933095 RepID=A0AAI8YPF5_9PEZI|nr:Uu.00g053640.m01.CDS01 [Anthostomella pinea]
MTEFTSIYKQRLPASLMLSATTSQHTSTPSGRNAPRTQKPQLPTSHARSKAICSLARATTAKTLSRLLVTSSAANQGPTSAIEADDNDVHRAIGSRLCAAFNRTTLMMTGGNTKPGLSSTS